MRILSPFVRKQNASHLLGLMFGVGITGNIRCNCSCIKRIENDQVVVRADGFDDGK